MAGHLLGHFKLPVVLLIDGDLRRPETVAGDFCRNAGGLSPASQRAGIHRGRYLCTLRAVRGDDFDKSEIPGVGLDMVECDNPRPGSGRQPLGSVIRVPFIRIDKPERFVGIVVETVRRGLRDRFASL